jgi:hypothetical protein
MPESSKAPKLRRSSQGSVIARERPRAPTRGVEAGWQRRWHFEIEHDINVAVFERLSSQQQPAEADAEGEEG